MSSAGSFRPNSDTKWRLCVPSLGKVGGNSSVPRFEATSIPRFRAIPFFRTWSNPVRSWTGQLTSGASTRVRSILRESSVIGGDSNKDDDDDNESDDDDD